jgi:hypothetical protein
MANGIVYIQLWMFHKPLNVFSIVENSFHKDYIVASATTHGSIDLEKGNQLVMTSNP